MLLAGLRRLALLTAAVTAGTAVVSVVVGLIAGASLTRSLSLGFYGVGCFTLVAGFFVGNRGPTRTRGSEAGWLPGRRRLRWARREEQEDTLANSALFIVVGLVLVVVGLAVDPRVRLV